SPQSRRLRERTLHRPGLGRPRDLGRFHDLLRCHERRPRLRDHRTDVPQAGGLAMARGLTPLRRTAIPHDRAIAVAWILLLGLVGFCGANPSVAASGPTLGGVSPADGTGARRGPT